MPSMTEPGLINYEREPKIVDEVVVLDLDRTLIDTSAVTQLVLFSMVRHGVSEKRVHKAIQYVEAQTGNSFHLFEYIEREFSIDTLETIIDEMMLNDALLDEMKDVLLCKGADKLIDALEARNTPAMILTYGEQHYQSFKIDLFRKLVGKTNKQLPGVVTDVANKSLWVEENWFCSSDELGEVPVDIMGDRLFARVISIVDDKISNLQSSDERIAGVLVDNRMSTKQGIISTYELAEAVAAGVHVCEIANVYEEMNEQRASYKLTNS